MFFSKHAKRHPNFNVNDLRQRRMTLSNVIGDTIATPDGSTGNTVPTVKNPGNLKLSITRLNKADSVNSSEETPSEPVSEENPFSDVPQRSEEEVAAALADSEKTSAQYKQELIAKFEDLKQKTAANVKSACEFEADSAQKIKLHTRWLVKFLK